MPQERAAFRPRPGLTETAGGARVRAALAVTGVWEAGRTQAAACAQRRIAESWRLVAWVDASDEASLLAGLAVVAIAAGVGAAGEDARVLAEEVRHWLETDGAQRLLVFDNADSLDMLRPFLPLAGTAQVIVTSSRRSAAGLGAAVPVDACTEDEALRFLAERTGLLDAAGARELAQELGFLPLGLAQAAALIARKHLSYGVYLGLLRAMPTAGYPGSAEGDTYRLAEAIELSLDAAEDRDPSGRCGLLMGLVAVLAETGVPRRLLHLAADAGVLGGGCGTGEADAAACGLADASLLGFPADDLVVAHQLVMRVVRDRLAAQGGLTGALSGAVRVLEGLECGIGEPWLDPGGVRELARHVSVMAAHVARHPGALSGEGLEGLLRLRFRSVSLLNELGDSTGLAILVAEPLVIDCEHLLGAGHPHTLTAWNALALAYQDAGRMAEAIPLHERVLTDFERLLGADHPDTLTARNNLATAYQDAGRMAEAIPLHERALADFERLLGADHLDTLTARSNLALAYQDAGRIAEAIPLHERVLADRERLLTAGHPGTLGSRSNLVVAYQDAGRMAEAVPLLERMLADCEHHLGPDHPDTLTSRSNLAMAYRDLGRIAEAIPLLERTLADCERVLGAGHPNTSVVRGNLAAVAGDTARGNGW